MNILRDDALLQGAEAALQAWTRASDAYAQHLAFPSVALWSVAIAVALVLLEWLLGRRSGAAGADAAGARREEMP